MILKTKCIICGKRDSIDVDDRMYEKFITKKASAKSLFKDKPNAVVEQIETGICPVCSTNLKND